MSILLLLYYEGNGFCKSVTILLRYEIKGMVLAKVSQREADFTSWWSVVRGSLYC